MTRAYRTSYKSHRGVRRFHVSVPFETIPESNSMYWREKLDKAMEVIAANPALAEIWDSELVPQNASYREHAEIALRLIAIPAEIQTIATSDPRTGAQAEQTYPEYVDTLKKYTNKPFQFSADPATCNHARAHGNKHDGKMHCPACGASYDPTNELEKRMCAPHLQSGYVNWRGR